MKNRKYLISTIALALAAMFGFSSCTPASETSSSSSGSSSEFSSSMPEAVDTGKSIIKNGRSDYKIVISKDADQMESYAADELVSFIYNSTGVRLPIVSDANITADFSGKYISIGNTTLSELSGLALDRETYTFDGFRIVTKDNTIILKGQSGYGTLYSVYGFLNYTIGYHAYAIDELYYEKKDEIALFDFDVTAIPDFEGRSDSHSAVGERTQAKDAARMGMYAGWQYGYTIFDGRVFGIAGHAARSLVPKNIYPEHWEATDGTQVCVTTDAVFNVWLENLKKVILDNPKSVNFQLGLEDAPGHCTCPSCKTEAEEHGGYGGVMIRFLNKLSNALDPWLQEVAPGREIELSGLAYYAWSDPPTKEDENGNVVPYDDTVVANYNVGIMYAPIENCFGCAINDPECQNNIKSAKVLKEWGAITDKISIYSYPDVYFNYLLPMNDWGSKQETLKYYKENGVYYFYDQGHMTSYAPMQDLKVYLNSQLLWKVDRNVDDLIDAFMENYYKAGGPYVRKYYDLTRAHYAKLKEEGIWTVIGIGAVGNKISSTEWPYAYCMQALQCFEDARKAVEDSNLDAKTKAKVLNRVDRDSTAVRFLILQNYPDYYTRDTFNAMIDEFLLICERGNIREYAEWGTTIAEVAAGWRKL